MWKVRNSYQISTPCHCIWNNFSKKNSLEIVGRCHDRKPRVDNRSSKSQCLHSKVISAIPYMSIALLLNWLLSNWKCCIFRSEIASLITRPPKKMAWFSTRFVRVEPISWASSKRTAFNSTRCDERSTPQWCFCTSFTGNNWTTHFSGNHVAKRFTLGVSKMKIFITELNRWWLQVLYSVSV